MQLSRQPKSNKRCINEVEEDNETFDDSEEEEEVEELPRARKKPASLPPFHSFIWD